MKSSTIILITFCTICVITITTIQIRKIVIDKNKLETISACKAQPIQIIVESAKDTILIKNSFFKNNIVDSEQADYLINSNIFSYLSKYAAIILAIFAAVFTLFTYFTQQNLSKAESIKEKIEDSMIKLIAEAENTKIEIENKRKEIDNYIKETTNSFETKYKAIAKISSELTSKIESNQIIMSESSKQIMIIFSNFLRDEYKMDLLNINDVIDLWDLKRTKFAALSLSERGNEKCIPFLEERLRFYEINNADINIVSNIKLAIEKIKERISKQ